MGEGIKGFVRRTTGTFADFSPAQKLISVLLVAGLAIGGLFFARWASAPSYAPLFSNLAPADASAIVEKLSAAGTPYELADGGGTILVPQEAVYDARVSMSGQGLPEGDQGGYSLLDKQGLTASEFRQRIDYQRALEGELKNTIQAIDGVETAVVHLAIPEKDVFADDDGKTTASVLVATKPGVELTNAQVRAIVNLTSSSIEGLKTEDVTVADASGKVLSAAADGSMAGADDTRAQQTQAYQDKISADVQKLLEPLVGAGRVVVKATADLDYDQTDTKSETFTAAPNVPPISESTATETYTGTGGTPTGGVLGPDNISVPNGAAGAGDYEKTSRTADNSVNKTTEQRKTAPGTVRRLNVAVLLDATAAGTVNANQIRTLVSSAVGIDAQRGDTIEVQRAAFNSDAADQAAADLEAAEAAEAAADRTAMIKQAGLALVVLLVLGLAWLTGRKRRKKVSQMELQKVQLELMRQQQQLELEAAARASLEAPEGALAAIEAGPGGDDAANKMDAMRDEIGDLVDSQPDEVAQLLRGWLADRRS